MDRQLVHNRLVDLDGLARKLQHFLDSTVLPDWPTGDYTEAEWADVRAERQMKLGVRQGLEIAISVVQAEQSAIHGSVLLARSAHVRLAGSNGR